MRVRALPRAALLMVALGLLSLLPAGWPRCDPVLLVIVPVALRRGCAEAGAVGFLGGVVAWLWSPGWMAQSTLVYGLTGALLGAIGEDPLEQGPWLPLLLTTAGTVAVGLGAVALGGPDPVRVQQWLPGALVANLLLTPAALWLDARLDGGRRLTLRV